jgi:hypothetical protein
VPNGTAQSEKNMVQCDVELNFSKLFDVLNFEELKKDSSIPCWDQILFLHFLSS